MSPTPSSLSSSAAGPLRSLEKSSGKKGKKFASVDWMLSLVDTVNKDEDKGVAKKLERMVTFFPHISSEFSLIYRTINLY